MPICEKRDCNEEFESRPCMDDRFCISHQLRSDMDYDDFVDPLHAYHTHSGNETFSHSPADKQ